MFKYFRRSPKTNTRYVLSLDGGGVRAIAALVFLKHLEIESGQKIVDLFDFFIGTSAGGINALNIAGLGMNAKDLEIFWSEENLTKTMSKSFWDNASFLQTKPKYDGIGKREVLYEYFKDLSLGESAKPVAVLTYDVEQRKPRLLSSYGTPGIKMLSAASATSAAPIYYSTYEIDDGSWLIDGGIVANNPSLLGYSEAKKLFPNNQIKVLSIGAGINRRKINGKHSSKWGALSWFKHDILGIMLESSMFDEIATDLIGQDYLRVNSSTGLVNRRMDDNSEVNLERIHLMGMDWWTEFGAQAKKFLNT
ncbi:MAG: phospholipase [SAR86 cluster bacterium BACL1 MAG-120920-bin57]|uniref:Phospholipase n=2 Tax=SAR86 cluster TaxID=62672 RepID=A0A0R2UEB0_9GAMM|nr:MAG: phospholipase [SAR86 cluster bacterium BACL1 MAG-120507-bin14]KRO40489.1 MAG: phospholipase [SAR86 cluster bacterium BACL1 MAG-120920-bin57]KRO95683.1 MAG: phospholipase [SAR86 cluster bacterium BACL1 MAG-120820-bin45]KRO97154.1 MAG: phospholipase [SAR86 cluster bacterium BACL1 MAG-120828-bin5]KRO98401.1 MAG: phospholipase [SAR86 cluster bacterium BACL1 MAG-120823-bin87]KRP00058.1 MAG: phospholipase [SAR86 cluster bacterium BACL1 MAG-120813-bin36]KRP02213.1 MAG: phospholipase [SAR86 c